MNDELNVVIRDFDPKTDQPFIFSSWRNASYFGIPEETRDPDAKLFFRLKTDSVRNILKRPETKIRIACLEPDPLTIIGWSCATGTHLQFVYVKIEYRNKGIGTLLLPKDLETVTSRLTTIGRALAEYKGMKVADGPG